MTRFAAKTAKTLTIEATAMTAAYARAALQLLIDAVPYADHRSLDVIALECLFVARLDGTKSADEAYLAARDTMLVLPHSTIIRSEDPLGGLATKITRLQRATEANCQTDTESKIRTLVNQTRKAFPGLGIKIEAQDNRLTITSDLVIRSTGKPVQFGSASHCRLGHLLDACETDLADWGWKQLARLRTMHITIVRRGKSFTVTKPRVKLLRRQNQNRYEEMSRQEAIKLAA